METALYLPVKRFLENLGFTVKGEVGGCDLVALSGDDPPVVVIGELKLSFNLELVLQAVDRAGACRRGLARRPHVGAAARGAKATRAIAISAGGSASACSAVTAPGDVEVLVKPPTSGPAPRSRRRRSAAGRGAPAPQGDPGAGRRTRAPIMTAYRQQALACASALSKGPRRVRELRPKFPTRRRSCCTMSMAGSTAPNAASMSYRRRICRAEALAAAANRLCGRFGFNSVTSRRY